GANRASGRLVLPRTFFVHSGERYWTGASLLVSAGTDIEACARSIESEIRGHLQTSNQRALAPAPITLDFSDGFPPWQGRVERILARLGARDVEKVVLARSVNGHSAVPICP